MGIKKFRTSKIAKFHPGGGFLRGTRPAETTVARARKKAKKVVEVNMVGS